jgi:E3 ubiquitin-protein ligase BAH
MKYAREFKGHLLTEGFPPHWVDSAISYGQLKKCIKRVQHELAALGLDAETLQRLLQTVEENQATAAEQEPASSEETTSPGTEKPFEYRFSGSNVEKGLVRPKLLFVVDAKTGEPLDATLAPETRNYLHRLAVAERLTNVRITDDVNENNQEVVEDDGGSLERSSSHGSGSSEERQGSTGRPRKYVEVPLLSDSEFFGVLEREVSGLAKLQEAEQKKLTAEIEELGTAVSKVTRPRDSKSRTDLSRWQRIFELYRDSNIFFATNEQDHGVHNRAKAQKQWEFFLSEVQKAELGGNFRRKENFSALEKFMAINVELLQSLRFQEINQIAMNKILKSTCSLHNVHT